MIHTIAGMKIETAVELYDSTMDWLKQTTICRLDTTFEFSEGPVWHPDQYFLFSDTPANKIYQWFTDGVLQVYLENSGLYHQNAKHLSQQIGSNGLAIDAGKNLFICQHGEHAIAMLNEKKELHTVTGEYNGAPFNSPNDITLGSDGSIWFTDPPYGLEGEKLYPGKFQPLAGIYKYDYNKVELMGTELQYPNGLCFSPDGKYLYVSSNFPDQKCILRYQAFPGGGITYKDVLTEENADGMTIDKNGHLYLAAEGGILIVSAKGNKLAFIPLPETPSNLSWGGANGEILFVTARSAVFFITK